MAFEFKFPDVGEGVHEGKILQLKFKTGDQINEGDIIAVIETDKVVAEIPSSKSGKLEKYGFAEGQVIEVGQTLAFISLEGATSAPVNENAGVVGHLETESKTVLKSTGEGLLDKSVESVNLTHHENRVRATPLARKLARDNGIDISDLKGSGPAGRVTKEDVLTATTPKAETKALPQVAEVKAPTNVEVIPLTTMRKTIAKKMEECGAIPTATFHEYAVVDRLIAIRREYNEQNPNNKLSFQPFFMKALGATLKKFPQFNATFDREKNEVTRYPTINIGLAVEAPKGLMVPVLKNVETKTVATLNKEMMSLVSKAKSETISMEELRGGTISITNYGSFGGIYGNPILLAPQVAILGIGRMHEAAVVIDGQIKAANILPLSFCFDHRVLDGAPSGQFITYLKNLLEKPERLIFEFV